MIELTLIGIGTGNPDHLTLQGIAAMQAADLILIPLKGADKSDLAGLRQQVCARHLGPVTQIVEFEMPRRDSSDPDYLGGVERWHDAIANAWETEIRKHLRDGGGKVALLIWGDPSLYDSTLRIAARLSRKLALKQRVIPGITAIQALCAAHAIPLNRLGTPVEITTGRRLRKHGWPERADTLVVMLDGECSFLSLPSDGLHIWWGAYVGMTEEILAQGPLAEAGPRIRHLRAEARSRHGWIMDIYLLRRDQTGDSDQARRLSCSTA